MPIISQHEQGSELWLLEKVGHLSASDAFDAMKTLAKGGETEASKKLKLALCVERLTGQKISCYVNDAMLWGIETEAQAREWYKGQTLDDVTQVGFCKHDHIEWLGCSPDGLVGADGLLEIKCPTSTTFVQQKLDGEIPERYIMQMNVQLIVMQRSWCDYLCYDPRLPLTPILKRHQPDPSTLTELEGKLADWLADVERILAVIR